MQTENPAGIQYANGYLLPGNFFLTKVIVGGSVTWKVTFRRLSYLPPPFLRGYRSAQI